MFFFLSKVSIRKDKNGYRTSEFNIIAATQNKAVYFKDLSTGEDHSK